MATKGDKPTPDADAKPKAKPKAKGNRDSRGHFVKGNTVGKMAKGARRGAKLRSAMLAAITEDDVRAVVASMVEAATVHHDPAAARLLFQYAFGAPPKTTATPAITLPADVTATGLRAALASVCKAYERGELTLDDLQSVVGVFDTMRALTTDADFADRLERVEATIGESGLPPRLSVIGNGGRP